MHLLTLAGPRRRTRRAILAAALPAALAAVAVPASAQAATAEIRDATANGVIRYAADAGETNNVRVSVSGSNVVIDDQVPIRAGAGCLAINGNAVCRANVDRIIVGLGDRNDVIQYVAPHGASVLGDAGNDTFFAGIQQATGRAIESVHYFGESGLDKVTYAQSTSAVTVSLDDQPNDGRLADNTNVRTDIEIVEGSRLSDTIFGSNLTDKLERFDGGDGNDTIAGGSGVDIFDEGDHANGSDTFHGGDGVDRVNYEQRTSRVEVRLDTVRNDGETGEFDFVQANVEQMVGGRAGDLLVGSGAANKMFGGSGDDALLGGGSGDFLSGGAGQDQLFGDSGNDVLEARDGQVDLAVDCGADSDTANRDAFELRVTGCESGTVGVLRLAPKALDAKAGEPAHVRLSWRHPQSWRKLRKVELRLTHDGSSVAEVTVRPRGKQISADGNVKLVSKHTRLSRTGKTVTARLALRLDDSLAGQTLAAEVEATDTRGRRQLETDAGTIRVAD